MPTSTLPAAFILFPLRFPRRKCDSRAAKGSPPLSDGSGVPWRPSKAYWGGSQLEDQQRPTSFLERQLLSQHCGSPSTSGAHAQLGCELGCKAHTPVNCVTKNTSQDLLGSMGDRLAHPKCSSQLADWEQNQDTHPSAHHLCVRRSVAACLLLSHCLSFHCWQIVARQSQTSRATASPQCLQ